MTFYDLTIRDQLQINEAIINDLVIGMYAAVGKQ